MEIYPSEQDRLLKLKKWLDYEISASTLYLFSWFWGILLLLAALAAIIFIPFMLKVLFQEKKYGWIISFFIFVILPALLIHLAHIGIMYKVILNYVPLGLFFFYCLTLKFAVRGWVLDNKFKRGEKVFIKSTDDVFNNYKF